MNKLRCPNCKKEFTTTRTTFYKGYRHHCSWCGQMYEVTSLKDGNALKPRIKKLKDEFVSNAPYEDSKRKKK
jgi:hypothetical protein